MADLTAKRNVDHDQRGGSHRRTGVTGIARREALEGYLFLLPSLVGMLVFSVFPILAGFTLAFTDWDLASPPRFAGLDNFVGLWRDWLFWKAMGNTLYWVVGSVPPTIVFAMILAVLINRKLRGHLVFRVIYFLPSVTLSVAVAVIFLWIYNPDFGLLNYLLSLFGVDGPAWTASSTWAMPSLIMMSWWSGTGGAMLIFLAGLQSIPEELYEAATVDGGSAWQKFRYITLPMLSPTTFFVLTTSLIGAFQAFDLFYVMTKGGPAFATTTIVLHIFNNAFLYFKMGYAAAMAVVLFGCIMVVTVAQWRAAKSWVYGFD